MPERLAIDTSKAYTISGRCEHCGLYKTFEHKVYNWRTRAEMPAHVTENGYLVGDGNCPFWIRVTKAIERRKKMPPLLAAGTLSTPPVHPAPVPAVLGSQGSPAGTAGDGSTRTIPSRDEAMASDAVEITAGGRTITITRAEAVDLVQQLVEYLAGVP